VILAADDLGAIGEEDVDLAFRVSERLRARTLLDQLAAAGTSRTVGEYEGGSFLRHRQNVALQKISEVQKRLLYEELSREERDALLQNLDELEQEELTVRTRLADEDPGFALLHRPDIPAIADVRSRLKPHQALLSFCEGLGRDALLPARSWVFVVTADDARVHPVPARRELQDLVGAYQALLRRRDGLEPRAGARLYDELLRAALDGLPDEVTDLIVVPDGVLARFPFAALRPSPDAEPIAGRYRITVAPSAATWLRLRQLPSRAAARTVLAIADPVPAANGAAGEQPRRTTWTEGLALPAIPGTRCEARSVIRRLGGRSGMLSGADATETALKRSDLHEYALLLLATHTVIDDEHPERTAVVLSPADDDQDGLLQAREIAALDFGGRVVVMSGCSSAGGENLEGEGIVGLARSFFVAGARTVVGSLWPLEDREAAKLVAELAGHLARGLGTSAALAAAQRDLLRAGAPPAAWAGLIVLGDGDHAPFPRGSGGGVGFAWWWLAAGGVLLVAAALLLRRRFA
jgi:CHAT domain-containing protein